MRSNRTQSTRRQQTGMSIWALLLIGALLLVVGGAGLRAAPSIIEHLAVRSAVAEAARESTPKAIRDTFQRQADVNDISSITSKDLIIEQDGNSYKVSYQYEKLVPLAGPVSLLIDYKGGSDE